MATSRHLVQRSIADRYVAGMVEHANRLPVGNPSREAVALGPIIDEQQRDRIHGIVTASVDAGARLAAGGRYEGLFYRPTVLADVPVRSAAFREEIFGPVAPVTPFDTVEEAIALARDTEHGLSIGVLTRDVMKGLALAERIPTGTCTSTIRRSPTRRSTLSGGSKASGAGWRLGGPQANLEAFTERQWVTMRGELPAYPF